MNVMYYVNILRDVEIMYNVKKLPNGEMDKEQSVCSV